MKRKMWVMISGPQRSGTVSGWHQVVNLFTLNGVALDVIEKGHFPIISGNCILPIAYASSDAARDEMVTTLRLELVKRCDACLRIGGDSDEAELEVQAFLREKKPVYFDIDNLPNAGQPS